MKMPMDDIDRAIVNLLQDGFPIAERPFAQVAETLCLTEADLIERVRRLCEAGILSRFGPLYNADRFGGHVTLATMAVPEDRFEAVAELVNSYTEVGHNYARDHALNMWFVVAAESAERVATVLDEIQQRAGLAVYDMPKIHEFHIGLRLQA